MAPAGGSNIERTRFNGFLAARLIAAQPELAVRVRNFGWEGDTVFTAWRDNGSVQNLDERRRQAELRIQRETGSTSWRQQRNWRAATHRPRPPRRRWSRNHGFVLPPN